MICNPNNPTGTRLAPQQILELAAAAPQTLVVVDELYEAFTGDSVLPLADFSALSNLLVLRSWLKRPVWQACASVLPSATPPWWIASAGSLAPTTSTALR